MCSNVKYYLHAINNEVLTIFISRYSSHLNHTLQEIYKRLVRNNNMIGKKFKVSIIKIFKIYIFQHRYYASRHKEVLWNTAVTFAEKITR